MRTVATSSAGIDPSATNSTVGRGHEAAAVGENRPLVVGRVLCERLVRRTGSEFVDVGHPFDVVPERDEPCPDLAVDVLVEQQPVAHRSVLGRGQRARLFAHPLLPALEVAHLLGVVVVVREREGDVTEVQTEALGDRRGVVAALLDAPSEQVDADARVRTRSNLTANCAGTGVNPGAVRSVRIARRRDAASPI